MSEIPSTPRLQAPKAMPRPRMARPGSSLATPLPLSHNDSLSNLPAPDSPSVLSPAPGMTMKLKVRSATTPEARSRVLLKPRPAGLPLGRPKLPAMRDDDHFVAPAEAVHQDLLDSMETPTLAPSETVLVSVR
jgi:centromeric protein E